MGGLKPGARSALAKWGEAVCGWPTGRTADAICSGMGVSATVWQIWQAAQVAQSAASAWCWLLTGVSLPLAMAVWPGQPAWAMSRV